MEALIWVRSVVIVLLIVAHALRHVQMEQPHQEKQIVPPVSVITPELLNELRALLSQTTVSEECPVTPLLPEATTPTNEPETPPVPLFPTVSEEDRNKVIKAYTQGTAKREICSYLHWGSAKYTTIVKPVLDAYKQQERSIGSGE